MMAEREHHIDFTVPFYDLVGFTILMKKIKLENNLFKFKIVLEDIVWGTILACYFVTSVLLWVFDRWSPYSYQNNKEKYEVSQFSGTNSLSTPKRSQDNEQGDCSLMLYLY